MVPLSIKQVTGRLTVILAALLFPAAAHVAPAEPEPDLSHGREMMLEAFEHEVREIETGWLDGIETLEDWEKRRPLLRRQLADMLGLLPAPPKTDLRPTITGTVDHPEFTVEKLHFQSMPGLYVTANLYLPKNAPEKVPVVLYLCGHARHIVDGVSYGNKFPYQHNPAWYARQGIASLIIDTLDRGEIQGDHHGTYRLGRWWWQNRGYTPGAVEVWNVIRGLDYLETRPEIDMSRVGTTGRSGGGIYSWLILALDDRVGVGTPTAGLTDLRDHVINGVIRGHCDCNYWNNYHRLDTTVLAALAAPRPVKLVNTDADPIFPTTGIRRIEEKVRKIYSLYDKEDHWAVYIGKGGHGDTRELQLETYPWMVRWLKGEEMTEVPEAKAYFEDEELRVFQEVPADEINTSIDQKLLAPPVTADVPKTLGQWNRMKATWMAQLRKKAFAGWPAADGDGPALKRVLEVQLDDLDLLVDEYSPQPGIVLRTWTVLETGVRPERVLLRVLDDEGWLNTLSALRAAQPDRLEEILGLGAHAVAWPDPSEAAFAELKTRTTDGVAVVLCAVRGVGPTFYEESRPQGDTITRSFPLLGQTLDGMRVWDVRQALTAIRRNPVFDKSAIEIDASGPMAGVVLYASLFDEPVKQLRLHHLPASHEEGPYLLNITEILDLPQTLAMARERTEVIVDGNDPVQAWSDDLRRRADSSNWARPIRLKRN